MDRVRGIVVPFWQRFLSRTVAKYPFARGRTRLRCVTAPWLVARLNCGAWVRTSGVVDAEWNFLSGSVKEEKTVSRVRTLLSEGMTFVDVGANVGYFSLLAASIVGASGRVIAFEPTPAVAERLRENIKFNGLSNVSVVEAAVSDQTGLARLFQSDDDPEANSLFDQPMTGQVVEIATVTLGAELARQNIRTVDLMKIDAEGSELAVLKGAGEMLLIQRPAIVLEVNPLTLAAAGVTPDQVFNQLTEYGYQWEEIDRVSWRGVTVTNIFATHRH